MSLNIKDPQAHELAQALAQETGETMTQAVIEALRERLERLRRVHSTASAEELLAIGQRCAAGLSSAPTDHTEFLYDERGLPR
ncbi:MAG: type II toxin-antitoxin system VapB family antitoxin [Burkholderiaceae bacterium]